MPLANNIAHGSTSYFFFLEHAGELRMFVLRVALQAIKLLLSHPFI